MSLKITVVGLGSGSEDQLTLGIWRKLQISSHIYVRTAEHPAIRLLQENNLPFQSFDHIYEQNNAFSDVYETITDKLIAAVHEHKQEIIYAVPGHPMVAEQTSQLLKQKCPDEGIELQFLGGESFLDQAFLRFGFDPIEGFQLLDGSQPLDNPFNPRIHTIVAQVYDTFTASDVKLGLMAWYPDDFPVVVGHALGVAGEESIQTIPLYELDRVQGYGNLSLVWIPRSVEESLQNRSFGRLQEIVSILRSPEGCPWDREQTHASLRKNLIEEACEVLETIDDDDPDAMCEELGDLLLQVMLHAQLEDETGAFNVYDVVQGLNEKLIRRHPHVFGTRSAGNSEEALVHWQQIKQEEKRQKGIDLEHVSILSGIPRDFSGLLKAWKLQKKAAQVGFDFTNIDDVIAKIDEELAELKAEIAKSSEVDAQKAELGDLLFSIVNLARFLKLDPEEAVALTNNKFIRRFCYIEEQLRLKNVTFDQTDLIEMEQYWQETKSFF
ncbi:nucleoside triphosphate pyrophosphohydrolase [Paenibacillus psychroresistens]|uniref:Nucleoside triphosphate pyrophosphohydrolase n=1 Tax=Paenibacillus psychroresistens TaxID=1778678 RepID=A0A6B8RE13_9BACL|nr:nucleoside triphosphate pyrophosphohydrolase [Paenibacillus psychroresistens]QGQ93692.1 nucleoside triphosphate pyrophosphohydrolase [Paenibacillus psychroresistens]